MVAAVDRLSAGDLGVGQHQERAQRCGVGGVHPHLGEDAPVRQIGVMPKSA
jgi:hypothetical protein